MVLCTFWIIHKKRLRFHKLPVFFLREIHCIHSNFSRDLSVDDTNTRKFVELYNDLEKFLKRDQFRDDLREELEQSHPGFLTVIMKWRSDLEKSDHGIVIAGLTINF